MSPPASFSVSPLVEAFLQTATSRKDAVGLVQKLYRTEGDEPPSDEVAVAMVEAYYAQRGGKPWLRPAPAAPGSDTERGQG